jgi:prophage regulatory protein
MPQAVINANIFLRLPGLKQKIGLSKSAIYQKNDPKSPYYDPSFPRPVKLGGRAVAWSSDAINAWMTSKLQGVA